MDGEDEVFVCGEGLRPPYHFLYGLHEPIISSEIESHYKGNKSHFHTSEFTKPPASHL